MPETLPESVAPPYPQPPARFQSRELMALCWPLVSQNRHQHHGRLVEAHSNSPSAPGPHSSLPSLLPEMCHSHIHGPAPNRACSVLAPHHHLRSPLSWMATALPHIQSSGLNSGVTSSWPFSPTGFICHSPLPLLALPGGVFSAHFPSAVSATPVVLATTYLCSSS